MSSALKNFTAGGTLVIAPSNPRIASRLYVCVIGTGWTGTVNFTKSIGGAVAKPIGYRKETDGTMATANIAADAMVSVDNSGGPVTITVTVGAGSVQISTATVESSDD